MAGMAQQNPDDYFSGSSFLLELYKKTKPLPVYANRSNQCVCINMSNCSQSFLRKLEDFISDNPDQFRLVARGIDYYLEILDAENFSQALQRSSHKRREEPASPPPVAREGDALVSQR